MTGTDLAAPSAPNVLASLAEENALLSAQLTDAKSEIDTLKNRIRWFEKQLFGPKSEKRLIDNPHQPSLLGEPSSQAPQADEPITITYQRGIAKKQRAHDCVSDSGLRFNEDVPVEVIALTPAQLRGPDADQYEVIDTKVSYKLAQRPASYVVLRYELAVIKHKADQTVRSTKMPAQVLEGSLADVSLLAGLLVDKFLYHLPLYRQHQRIEQAGITVSRATLTNLVKRAIELLRPIVQAQLRHLLQSKVLAMDETPIKASRQGQGKMKQGYFWPVYGEAHEVVFTYSDSRGRQHIERTLKSEFRGTLLSDGYAAYARYVEKTEGLTHAQCWVHCRRKFVEAQASDPPAVEHVLALIGQLYANERHIEQTGLHAEKKRQYRLAHSKPLVDRIFQWCQDQCQRAELTPRHPLSTALKYLRAREQALRVFLENPAVPLDTNHLERQIRPIPLGRKNWLFCWTELGAEHVGLIQSLISTCKLHGINPHTYLTDVLQRVDMHPANKVEELTPRVWKTKFADQPLRSVLDKKVNYVPE